MSRLTFPRPTQLKNVSYPTDDADAVPYGLVRDLIPIPPQPTLAYNIALTPDRLTEGQEEIVTGTLNAFVQHPIPGDGITGSTITSVRVRPLVGSSFADDIPNTILSDGMSFRFDFPADSDADRIVVGVTGNAMGIVNGIQGNHAINANVNIPVSPNWYFGVLATQPTTTSDLTDRGPIVVGSMSNATGIPGGRAYIWWPTLNAPNRLPFVTTAGFQFGVYKLDANGTDISEPGYAGDVTDGNHTLYGFRGMQTSGTLTIVYRG